MNASSSRELIKEFFEEFNKTICKSTINTILNNNLSKPLKITNTFKLTNTHEEKRIKFAKFILDNNINTDNIFLYFFY